MVPFCRQNCQSNFLVWKLYFDLMALKLCGINSCGPNYQWAGVGTDDVLASNRRQAIIITNGGSVYWCIFSRFKIKIHSFIKITCFQDGLIHWYWYWTIAEFYPCLLFITVDKEILIKAWSRCNKDHHKWKRSDSPCNHDVSQISHEV